MVEPGNKSSFIPNDLAKLNLSFKELTRGGALLMLYVILFPIFPI